MKPTRKLRKSTFNQLLTMMGAIVFVIGLTLRVPVLSLAAGAFILLIAVFEIGVKVRWLEAQVAGEEPTEQTEEQKAVASKLKTYAEASLKSIQKFEAVVRLHKKVNSPLTSELTATLDATVELYNRLAKEDQQTIKLASLNYERTFDNLTAILGHDYYLDIQANPKLWPQAERQIQEITKAVTVTHQQIISNIQQLNENKTLDFNVALNSLLATQTEATPEAMFKSTLPPEGEVFRWP